MRYVYMVTDGAGCWPMLRDEPGSPLWADGQPTVEVELLAALPDAVAERLFYDLAELAFARDGSAVRSHCCPNLQILGVRNSPAGGQG